MRLKHIKNAETLIYESDYIIKDPYKYKGTWDKIFNNNNPIEIEIGMGKGNFFISRAINNPNINYIGIEKYASVLLYALKKLKELNIKNIKIICVDAINIDEIFDKEIDLIYLNFSDPWPKKRHAKRRLTSNIFLEKYEKLFKEKTNIEMKTDNEDLFSYSLEQFKENNYNILEIDRNRNDLYKTEYEEKFMKTGKNINYVKVTK